MITSEYNLVLHGKVHVPIEEWAACRGWQKPRARVVINSIGRSSFVSTRGRAKLIYLGPIERFHATVTKCEEGCTVEVVPPCPVRRPQGFEAKRSADAHVSRRP
eukprot:SAG31_NODE_3023_length_4780_cov_5.085665_4_plen_104_part_00